MYQFVSRTGDNETQSTSRSFNVNQKCGLGQLLKQSTSLEDNHSYNRKRKRKRNSHMHSHSSIHPNPFHSIPFHHNHFLPPSFCTTPLRNPSKKSFCSVGVAPPLPLPEAGRAALPLPLREPALATLPNLDFDCSAIGPVP
jgi:hypothetical protein